MTAPPKTTKSTVPEARSGREARREERVRAMLDRAMTLTREGGIEGLTLQKLSASLGFVTTSVYRYFPSKDALVAALQREAIARIGVRMAGALPPIAARFARGGVAPPLAALLAAAEVYLELPQTEPDAFALVATLLGDPREHLSDDEAAKTAPVLASLLSSIATGFDEAAAAKLLEPGSSVERTLAYWGAIHGALCLEKVRRGSPLVPPARVVGMTSARALLRGFGATSLG
ncbi:MAG: TetR/AcrR family transcriptional regulator [Myxococcales bacterium]|nr:TetR/AcrR family transcriptional regulator [Myxococcales bacterium]